MNWYAAYGLTIASELTFPELVSLDPSPNTECDLVIRVQEGKTIPVDPTENYATSLGEDEVLFSIAGLGVFGVEQGHTIRAAVAPDAAPQALRLFLLGPALSLILHQRGHLVLHASAVGLPTASGDVGVVGFLGESREGKSTMAAALCARGNRAVADDIVALPTDALQMLNEGEPPWIAPGFPVLKLWPEASATVYGAAEMAQLSPQIAPTNSRRVRHVGAGFALDVLPLLRLYVLETGNSIRSTRLAPHEALLKLMSHAYWAYYLTPEQRESLFRRCSVLAARLPVYRLERPRKLELLDEVARFVEAEVHSLDVAAPQTELLIDPSP